MGLNVAAASASRWQVQALFFASTFVAALLALGCAKSTRGVTTITFWTIGHEGEVVQPLLREFERDHPAIRVALQQWPSTAAHEKLLTAFAGNALPDVSQLGNTWIPEFATIGALEQLQPYVEAAASMPINDYFSGIWDSNVIEGHLFGVPWYVDTRLLFYRKDLLASAGFAEPPRDWTQWQRQLAAVKAHVGPKAYAILLPLNEAEPLLNLAIQERDPLLKDDDTRGNFESAGFRHAFDFYISMFRNDWAPPLSDTQISNVWDEFAAGFYTFYISGPWNVTEFSNRLPPRLAHDWGTAPLPGPNGPGAAIGGGSSLVMFKTSQHKREVWQLIEFLSQPKNQLRFHALSGDLPPRRSAWGDPTLANDPYAKAFRDQLERVKSAPKVPEWERITQEIRLTTERVVRGGEQIDIALRDLDARTDAILAKRRWMLANRSTP